MVSDRRPLRLETSNTSRRTTADPAASRSRSIILDAQQWRTLERFTRTLYHPNQRAAGRLKRMDRDRESSAEVWSRLVGVERRTRLWSTGDRLIADGTFCRAKKGANWSARAERERVPLTVLILMDGDQTPLASESSRPPINHEVRHIERLARECGRGSACRRAV